MRISESLLPVAECIRVVLNSFLAIFNPLVSTITGNPLLYVPVLIGLLGGLVLFAIGIIKKLGIHGISSAGRRRVRRK